MTTKIANKKIIAKTTGYMIYVYEFFKFTDFEILYLILRHLGDDPSLHTCRILHWELSACSWTQFQRLKRSLLKNVREHAMQNPVVDLRCTIRKQKYCLMSQTVQSSMPC